MLRIDEQPSDAPAPADGNKTTTSPNRVVEPDDTDDGGARVS